MEDALRLERLLNRTLLRFWNARICDERGGYRLNHDRSSVWQGPAPKALVSQSRTLWFFSRLCTTPYATAEHARCAASGFSFLAERLRDAAHGGYYWAVDDEGTTPLKPLKHLYGQSFALFALAEYAHAFGDAHARDLARELFSRIEHSAHDRRYGGYIECFDRSWSAAAAPGYLPENPPAKTLNTHLHLLESFTRYYQLDPAPLVRERILELLVILATVCVRHDAAQCTGVYSEDWLPLLDGRGRRVSYGHDLEVAWLLLHAAQAAQIPVHPLLDLARTLADSALRLGFDSRRGGFYHEGLLRKRPSDRTKVWWVQAEALLSLTILWKFTGAQRYRTAATRTLDWICDRQADWTNGEWFAAIDAKGRPHGEKTGPWKDPYHQGRAVLESLALARGDRTL
jgi:mannobiose 2-epimerase